MNPDHDKGEDGYGEQCLIPPVNWMFNFFLPSFVWLTIRPLVSGQYQARRSTWLCTCVTFCQVRVGHSHGGDLNTSLSRSYRCYLWWKPFMQSMPEKLIWTRNSPSSQVVKAIEKESFLGVIFRLFFLSFTFKSTSMGPLRLIRYPSFRHYQWHMDHCHIHGIFSINKSTFASHKKDFGVDRHS